MKLRYYSGHRPVATVKGLWNILDGVCASRDVTRKDVLGRGQTRKIAHARQEAMILAYASGKYSTPTIGWFFDRDHATVIWAVQRGRLAMNPDEKVRACVTPHPAFAPLEAA